MLTQSEAEHAANVLGREPSPTEMYMLDVVWSEHCSYKSSRRWFHLLQTKGDKIVLETGEGAGLVDIGGSELVGIAMDSHNHPSQIDPYNGAATGVGGIIRDVLSQGCRPVGLLSMLRFGHIQKEQSAHLLENAVRGISDYGNGVGIPAIGGEVEFDDAYSHNCLVNMVCIGYVKVDKVIRSIARTPGHALLVLGSTAGRDGISGAIFASKPFSDQVETDRGSVQIGDPLAKKVLIDTLEEIGEEGLLAGLQDIGGGGLASAAGEMAAAGGTGVNIDLEKVPLREQDMEPWEIVISESQERMLAVVAPENLERVILLCQKNDTPYAVIGETTDDGLYTARLRGKVVARLPIGLLVGGAPEPERVEGKLTSQTDSLEWYKEPEDYREIIMRMMESINICDRSWIYKQYDQHVQANTVVDIGENAGVIQAPNGRLLAFTSDCNSFWCRLDPQEGAANSAAESLRNLVSMGAQPLFMADCLNFGNPERPEAYAQFVEAVRGVGRFSHDFDIPVVGGNVSFYNESTIGGETRGINPTPQIVLGGIFPQGFTPVRRNLVTPWANVYLIGDTLPELNGSEYQRLTLGNVRGVPPKYRPRVEKSSMNAVLEAHSRGLIRSCNDVGRGGLIASLMKMALWGQYGFKLDLEYIPGTVNSLGQRLFSESSSRYIAEVTESNQPEFLSVLEKHGLASCELGLTLNEPIADFGRFSVHLDEAREAWRNGLRKYLD
jgi:phosphoribosylformylglycinamidine synthase II